MLGLTTTALTVATILLLGAASPAAAIEPIFTGLFSDLAVGGYDPVAYFTLGKPTPGDDRFTFDWRGARWRFSNADHRARFVADPERFAPQYGGYCAWAVAQEKEASGDPEQWRIVDGKLYLNYDASVQKKWEVDIPGFIARANANWPKLLVE